jgi:hypothetical protein
MDVAFQQGVSPKTTWITFGRIALTIAFQNFGPFTFDCSTTDATNVFKFMVGGNNASVYVDDVVVLESATLKSSKVTDVPELTPINDNVTIYPNPVADVLNVNVPATNNAKIAISIVDLQGRVLATKNYVAASEGINVFQFDVQSIAQGSYLVKISTSTSATSKMIVIKR